MTPVPILDPEALNALRQLSEPGDESVLKQLVELFIGSTPARLDALQSHLKAASFMQIEKEAHSLKSSSANLGALRLSELCKSLELAARAQDLATLPSLISNIVSEYESASAALQQLPEMSKS